MRRKSLHLVIGPIKRNIIAPRTAPGIGFAAQGARVEQHIVVHSYHLEVYLYACDDQRLAEPSRECVKSVDSIADFGHGRHQSDAKLSVKTAVLQFRIPTKHA